MTPAEDDIILETLVRLGPSLHRLIEGNVGVTITSRDRWLAYFGTAFDKVKIKVGDPLPYESNSAKCMRENRIVIEKKQRLLGWPYIGRAIPICNSRGEIIGSWGYLRVLDGKEEVKNIIIGRNREMRKIFRDIPKIADADTNVLLMGETGTGKDLLASLIHKYSNRVNKLLLPVNCSAVPAELFESEMFGYEAGAFTGANKAGKKGFFELCNGGTIYLDEIGDLDFSLQSKLLRVLQTKKVFRIGGSEEIDLDIRVISATNQNLEKNVLANKFRRDLYFRLTPIVIHVPPLRKRREDLPLLIDHILRKKSIEFGKKSVTISAKAYKLLLEYDYPGNVRELENIIQRGVILAENNVIRERDLEDAFHLSISSGEGNKKATLTTFKEDDDQLDIPSIQDIEKRVIVQALERFRKKKDVASALRISRDTLYRKMQKYGIPK